MADHRKSTATHLVNAVAARLAARPPATPYYSEIIAELSLRVLLGWTKDSKNAKDRYADSRYLEAVDDAVKKILRRGGVRRAHAPDKQPKRHCHQSIEGAIRDYSRGSPKHHQPPSPTFGATVLRRGCGHVVVFPRKKCAAVSANCATSSPHDARDRPTRAGRSAIISIRNHFDLRPLAATIASTVRPSSVMASTRANGSALSGAENTAAMQPDEVNDRACSISSGLVSVAGSVRCDSERSSSMDMCHLPLHRAKYSRQFCDCRPAHPPR